MCSRENLVDQTREVLKCEVSCVMMLVLSLLKCSLFYYLPHRLKIKSSCFLDFIKVYFMIVYIGIKLKIDSSKKGCLFILGQRNYVDPTNGKSWRLLDPTKGKIGSEIWETL